MSEDTRATLTGGLWFLSAFVLVALFISAAAQGELTTAHIVLASVILALAVIASPILLRMKDSDEKSKRRVDRVLDDLSDEELIELKRRLAGVDERAGSIADYLDDDGELVRRR
jgi:hypothetical protein